MFGVEEHEYLIPGSVFESDNIFILDHNQTVTKILCFLLLIVIF